MLEPEELDTELVKRSYGLQLRVWNHLIRQHQTGLNHTMSMDQDLKDIEDVWLNQYHNHNLEVRDADNMTLNDLLFVTRCHILVAQSNRAEPQTHISQMREVTTYVQSWSCNHIHPTDPAFVYSYTQKALYDMDMAIAEIVVYGLSNSTQECVESIQQMEPIPLPGKCLDVITHIKSLASLRRWNESEGDYKKRKQPEYGVYWLNNIEEEINSFISLCSRVMYRVHYDNMLYMSYKHYHMKNNPVTESHRIKVHTWLQGRVQIELSDTFVRTYRNVCFESWIPLGGRTISARKESGNKDDALTCLESVLGVDTAAYMQSLVEIPLVKVAGEVGHPMYDTLLLIMFHYMMTQMTNNKVRLIGDIILLHYHLGDEETKKLIATQKRYVCLDRRPLIVQLRKQWYIHNHQPYPQSRWIPCPSLCDALVLWCMLVKKQFEGVVGNYVDVDDFVTSFI